MNGNINQSEELAKKPDNRPRWRKKRWWAVGLFLTWYLHPLVWQIPGLWYLPLPLQCEYGDYDSAAIRKLVREARAMQGEYRIFYPGGGPKNNAIEFNLPLEQFLQDFVSKGRNRDETLARIHAFILANGGTIIAERIFKEENKNGDFGSLYINARLNLINFGFLIPYPIFRTGYLNIRTTNFITIDKYIHNFSLSSQKLFNKNMKEFSGKANLSSREKFLDVSAGAFAYFPGRTTDNRLSWGLVNTCLPRSELPRSLTIHRQDVAKFFQVPTHKNQ